MNYTAVILYMDIPLNKLLLLYTVNENNDTLFVNKQNVSILLPLFPLLAEVKKTCVILHCVFCFNIHISLHYIITVSVY